jgi:hypothetical protein
MISVGGFQLDKIAALSCPGLMERMIGGNLA